MTVSIDGNPVLTLRGWAKAYRKGPAKFRFPSDPHAEFFPRDLDFGADEIERLTATLQLEAEYRINAVAEATRLRAALKRIVAEADSDDGLTAWDGGDIARAALEQQGNTEKT